MVYTVFDALRTGFGSVVVVTRPSLRQPLDTHLREHLGDGLPVAWVFQEIDDVPDAHRARARGSATTREKPWGTGQAVLCARPHLEGVFGVANADDWYGPEALEALAGALREPADTGAPPAPARTANSDGEPACPAVLVGFPMGMTLPPDDVPGAAGVSRGWVRDRAGEVESVLELRDVTRAATTGAGAGSSSPEAGAEISGLAPDGRRVKVRDDAWASMNLWGFRECALPLLESAFERFLAGEGALPEAEFALSSAVDGLVREGSLTLDLVPGGRRWFGITHPGDARWVRERLRRLHTDGTYPGRLADAVPDLLAHLAP
jgi:hypothetical protein